MANVVTRTELLKQARTQVPEVAPQEVAKQLQGPGPKPLVIDVREKDEVDAGIVPGARHVPRGFLDLRIEEAVPDRDTDLVLYCAGGTRSLLGGKLLREMGYTRVRSMAGGDGAWKSGGVPGGVPGEVRGGQRGGHSPDPL